MVFPSKISSSFLKSSRLKMLRRNSRRTRSTKLSSGRWVKVILAPVSISPNLELSADWLNACKN